MSVHILMADDSDLGAGGMWIVGAYADKTMAYIDLAQLNEVLDRLPVRSNYRVANDAERAWIKEELGRIDPQAGGNIATVTYSVAEHEVILVRSRSF